MPSGFVIDDNRFDRLNAWNYIMMQLKNAELSLGYSSKYANDTNIDRMEQVLVGQSFFVAAIVAYGKCFNSSGNGRISLDKKKVFKDEDELKVIHDRLIDIRNGFAAHSDTNDLDIANTAVNEKDDVILIRHLYTVATPFREYPDFLRVIRHSQKFVVESINKYRKRLEADLGKPLRLS